MAKRSRPIQKGDRVLVEHEVTAVWPDGRITYEIPGTAVSVRATVPADHHSIREVIAEKPEPKAKPGRVRIGGSALSKIFDEGRGG